MAERGETVAAERDLTRARELFTGIGATAAAFATETEARPEARSCGATYPNAWRGSTRSTRATSRRASSPSSGCCRAQATATARLRSESLQALTRGPGRLEALGAGRPRGPPGSDPPDAAGGRRARRAGPRAPDPAIVRRPATPRVCGARRQPGAGGVDRGRRCAPIGVALGPPGRQDPRRRRLAPERRGVLNCWSRAPPSSSARWAWPGGSSPAARCSCAAVRLPTESRPGTWRRCCDWTPAIAPARSGRSGTGLGLLEGYRETLGASELRATASEIGVELAQLGLRIALAGADTRSMLAWADRLRGERAPPAAGHARRTCPSSGTARPSCVGSVPRSRARSGASESARALLARQAAARGDRFAVCRDTPPAEPRPGTLHPAGASSPWRSGGAALVELIELDGTLTALALTDGRVIAPRSSDRSSRSRKSSSGCASRSCGWRGGAMVRLSEPRCSKAPGHRPSGSVST